MSIWSSVLTAQRTRALLKQGSSQVSLNISRNLFFLLCYVPLSYVRLPHCDNSCTRALIIRSFILYRPHRSFGMAVTLRAVEETLFLPLWCRAYESLSQSLLYDPIAIELVNSVDYDFSVLDAQLNPVIRLASVARAIQCDSVLKTYISNHPRASVIDLGAGLDTGFYRVDNGMIEWYDLDLPNVIALRQQLLPPPERVHSIPKSLLDISWCDDIVNIGGGVCAVAGAVLGYFSEAQVKKLFLALADRLPGTELVFTAYSGREVSLINRSLQRVGMKTAAMKWALEDSNEVMRWDDRIALLENFSFFRGISYDPAWDEETIRTIRAIDERKRMRIVHVRV
ncbi:MAG: class I SAM-dependent methyltransferase [Halobacteriota archaeon]